MEALYERLATAIDAVPESATELFLTKALLLLAREHGDLEAVLAVLESAAQDLD